MKIVGSICWIAFILIITVSCKATNNEAVLPVVTSHALPPNSTQKPEPLYLDVQLTATTSVEALDTVEASVPTIPSKPTPIAIDYGITDVELPAECYGKPSEGKGSIGEFQPCSDFEFSDDNRYLGLRFGPSICGRGIIIMDTQSGEVIYHSGVGYAHDFEHLTNGKIWISRGHCESSTASLLTPSTGEIRVLGGSSGIGPVWNTTRTAFAMRAQSFYGLSGSISGYNLEKDFIFIKKSQQEQLSDHMLWTPDGSYLLYQHRVISGTIGSDDAYTFPQSRQIMRVDATTGESKTLVSDPQYDYHFCGGPYSRCDQWFGEWVKVYRFPFEPQRIPHVDYSHDLPEIRCLLDGKNCSHPPEILGLNWRTGELVPKNEVPFPTSTPRPTK